MQTTNRFAMISIGNEESYGLLFAATEFKRHGEVHFFDAENGIGCERGIINYAPDYLCLSPMTQFYPRAKEIEKRVKAKCPKVVSIYGGHHATNAKQDLGDITVLGAVHDLDLSKRGIVEGGPTNPANLKVPARMEYFRDIPRMENRYRKFMLSVTGCPFACSYCSSCGEKSPYSLVHRNMDDIFSEARFIKGCSEEVEWVDDDVLYGDQDWLCRFYERWAEEISLPMYVSTSSINAMKAPSKLLEIMRKSVNCIGLGMQAARPSSLKLFNRAWDSEEKVTLAYDRLTYFGFKVNLQCIIGLPLPDPIEDALDTIEGAIRIGKGSIPSCYPLQIYPNTGMEKYCKENRYQLNPAAGNMNSGLPGIDFGEETNKKLINLYKLSTMAVKYGIEREWLEAMLDMDLSGASKAMSMRRYYECIHDRLPDKADRIFASIIGGMNFQY